MLDLAQSRSRRGVFARGFRVSAPIGPPVVVGPRLGSLPDSRRAGFRFRPRVEVRGGQPSIPEVGMTKSRMTALGAVAAFALLLIGGAGPAAAQTTGSSTPLAKVMKVTGTAKNGKKFKGTFTINRFATKNGKTYAVGTMRGRLKHRSVTRRNVFIPATVARQAQSSQVPPITPTPHACQILSLHLGAIDLNLLGLRVRTNPIDALIEAVPGAGNLLGNLLCTITGLLDPGSIPTSQVTALLNAILAILEGL